MKYLTLCVYYERASPTTGGSRAKRSASPKIYEKQKTSQRNERMKKPNKINVLIQTMLLAGAAAASTLLGLSETRSENHDMPCL